MAGYTEQDKIAELAGILGIVMLVTAALAYCPLYPAMKIDTTCTTCKPK